jgi:demethylmenaquinone methyltransferase/2-methoxy-6-polyprenyl-1,4-benzoquinol methylase
MPATDPSPGPWNDQLLADPQSLADKPRRVQRMFAAIAPSYDLNNRIHSLWMDQLWRKEAVRIAEVRPGDHIVDVACGTGDLSLKFAAAHPASVTGIDFTFEMLPLAKSKAIHSQLTTRNSQLPTFLCGDALALPLPDQSADIVSIAFGIRNVADPAAALREFHRILRPGGRLVILEFSLPKNPLLRALYNLYFRHILPKTATLISGDKTGAYKYLPESVNTFISRQRMIEMMRQAGFTDLLQRPMTFGVCVCYRGVKV